MVLGLVNLEIDQILRGLDSDIRNRVLQGLGGLPFLLFSQHDCHDLMDLEGLGDQPLQGADVDVGEEGVVLVEGGVGLEKGVVVGHCQRQSFVGLVEFLHEGCPGEEFFLFQFFAGLEDVPSVVDLVLKQFVFGHPQPVLEETDFGLVETGVLDREPTVAACLDLVD